MQLLGVDIHPVHRSPEVVGLVALRNVVENVAADDDVVGAGRDAGQRRGQRAAVAASAGHVARVQDTAKQRVAEVPLVIGGDVQRVVPGPLRRVGADVADTVVDGGIAPRHRVGRDLDRIRHDEVRGRRERHQHGRAVVRDIVDLVVLGGHGVAAVRGDERIEGAGEPVRYGEGPCYGVRLVGAQTADVVDEADKDVGGAIEQLVARQIDRVVPVKSRGVAAVAHLPCEREPLAAGCLRRRVHQVQDQIGRCRAAGGRADVDRRGNTDVVVLERVLEHVVRDVGVDEHMILAAGKFGRQNRGDTGRVGRAGDELVRAVERAEVKVFSIECSVARQVIVVVPVVRTSAIRALIRHLVLDLKRRAGRRRARHRNAADLQIGSVPRNGYGERSRNIVVVMRSFVHLLPCIGRDKQPVGAVRDSEGDFDQRCGAVLTARGDKPRVRPVEQSHVVGIAEDVVRREDHGVAPCRDRAVARSLVPDRPVRADRRARFTASRRANGRNDEVRRA